MKPFKLTLVIAGLTCLGSVPAMAELPSATGVAASTGRMLVRVFSCPKPKHSGILGSFFGSDPIDNLGSNCRQLEGTATPQYKLKDGSMDQIHSQPLRVRQGLNLALSIYVDASHTQTADLAGVKISSPGLGEASWPTDHSLERAVDFIFTAAFGGRSTNTFLMNAIKQDGDDKMFVDVPAEYGRWNWVDEGEDRPVKVFKKAIISGDLDLAKMQVSDALESSITPALMSQLKEEFTQFKKEKYRRKFLLFGYKPGELREVDFTLLGKSPSGWQPIRKFTVDCLVNGNAKNDYVDQENCQIVKISDRLTNN